MTGLSTTTFGLAGRGFVREDLFADLCVFDAETVIDRTDVASPCLPSTGIETVIDKGVALWRDGAAAGAVGGPDH